MQEIIDQVTSWGPVVLDAIKALFVLVFGWIAAGMVSRAIRRKVLAEQALDDTIGSFFAAVVRWMILIIVLVAVLGIFGIEATSLVAVLGAATLAIGLALQGTMSDVAAGILLIFFRPYKLGDYVDIGGTSGTVEDINLFLTTLKTPQNVKIVMPNGKAWGAVITNYSVNKTRRLDLVFGIDYGDDADKAIEIISSLATAEERIHTSPEPWVRVTALSASSVDITARLWCDNSEYWDLNFTLTKAIKEAFDKEGISIPYPHVVHVQKEK